MGCPHGVLCFSWNSHSAISVKNSVWVILILLTFIGVTPVNASLDDELYTKHCQGFVPASKAVNNQGASFNEEAHALSFHQASYEGGDSIFNRSDLSWNTRSKSVSFFVSDIWQTEREDVFKISGRLMLRGRSYVVPLDRGFRRPSSYRFRRGRPLRLMPRVGVLDIIAEGFWSKSSHRVCMIGSGYRIGDMLVIGYSSWNKKRVGRDDIAEK